MKFKRLMPNKPLVPRRPHTRCLPVWYRKPWSRTARKSFKARPEVVELIDGLAETELLHHPDQCHQEEYRDQMAWQENSSQYGAYGREYFNRPNQHPSHSNSPGSSYSQHNGDYNKENAYRKNTRSDHRNGASELDYYSSRSSSNRYAASSSDRSPRNYDRDSHHRARSPERRYNSRSPPRQRNDYSPYSHEREHFSRSPRKQRDSRRSAREDYVRRNSSSRSPGQCYSRTPPLKNKRKLGRWSRSRSPSWDRTKSQKTEHRDSGISPQTPTEKKRRRKSFSSNLTDGSEKKRKEKYFNEHKHKHKHKKTHEEYKHSPVLSGRSSERSWNVNQFEFQNGKNPHKWVGSESNIPEGLPPVSSEDLLDNSQRSEEAESDCNGDSNNNPLLERTNKVAADDDASSVLSVGAKSYSSMSEMNKEELEMRRHVTIEELEKEKKSDDKVESVSGICSKGSHLKVDTQNSEKKSVLNLEDDYSGEVNEMKNDNTEAVKGKNDVEFDSNMIGEIFQDKAKEPIPATIAMDGLFESSHETKFCENVSNNDQSKAPHMQLIDTLEQSKEKAPGMRSYIDTLLTSGILNTEKKKKHVNRNENTSGTVSVHSTKTNQLDKLKDQHPKRNRNSSGNETNSKIVNSDYSRSGIANTGEDTIHTKTKLMIDAHIIHDKSNNREERTAFSDKHCENHKVNDSEYKSSDTTEKTHTIHISIGMENPDSRKQTLFSNEKSGKREETIPSKTTDRPANTSEEQKRFRRECDIKQNKGESVPNKHKKVKQNDNVDTMKSDLDVYNNTVTEVEKSHQKLESSTGPNENTRSNKKFSGNKTENTDTGEHSMPKGNSTPDSVRQNVKPVLTRSPSVVEGKMCRPSFGEYIPLGKSCEKKRPPVSAWDREPASKCKLFGKDQKGISHFAQKQSNQKKCSSPLKRRKELKSGKIVKHAFQLAAVRRKKLVVKKIGKELVSNNTSEISKEKNGSEKNNLKLSNEQGGKEERLSQEISMKKQDLMKPDEKILSVVMNENSEEHRQSNFINAPTNQYTDDNKCSEKVHLEQKKVKGNKESDKGEKEKIKKHGQSKSSVSKPNTDEFKDEKVTENLSDVSKESSEYNNQHDKRTAEQLHKHQNKESEMNKSEGKRVHHCSGNIFEKMVEENTDRESEKVAEEKHSEPVSESVNQDQLRMKDVRTLKSTNQSEAIPASNTMDKHADVKSGLKNKMKIAETTENKGNISTTKEPLSHSDDKTSCKNKMLSLKPRTQSEQRAKSRAKVLYYDESKNETNMPLVAPVIDPKLDKVSGTNGNADVKESEICGNDITNGNNPIMVMTIKTSGDSVEKTCSNELVEANSVDSNREESKSAELNVMRRIHVQLPACVPTYKKKLFKSSKKHTTFRQMSEDKIINSEAMPLNQNGESVVNELVLNSENNNEEDLLMHTEGSDSGKVTSPLSEQWEMDIEPTDMSLSDLKQPVPSNELPVKATNELTSEITCDSPNKDPSSNCLDTEKPKLSADTVERNSVPSESKPEYTSGELNDESNEDNHLDSCNFDEEDIEPIEMIGSVFTNERDLDAEEHEQNDFIERKQSENEDKLSANFSSDDVITKVKFCDDILVIKGTEKKDIKNNGLHNTDETPAEISENNELRAFNKTPRKKFAATLSGLGKILHEQTKSKALPKHNGWKSKDIVVPAKDYEIFCKNKESDNESGDEELLSIGIELTPSKQSSACKEWLQKAKSKAIKVPSNLKSKGDVKNIQQKQNHDPALSDTNNDVPISPDGSQVPSLGEVSSRCVTASSIDKLAKRIEDRSIVNGRSGNNSVSNCRSPVEEPGLSTMHAEMDVTGITPITEEHTVGKGTVINTERDPFVEEQSSYSMNMSTDSSTEWNDHVQDACNHNVNESEFIPILPNDLEKKYNMSALTNRIEVVHTKYLTNGNTVQTAAYLCPKKFDKATLIDGKSRSKCLCCQSCSMLFSPLDFTLHHDTGNIVELIDPVRSKRSEYRLAEKPSKDVANIFKHFIQYFHSEREQGCNLTRLPQAKSSKSVEKSIPNVSKSSQQISNSGTVNNVGIVGCPVSEEVQPQEDVSSDRVSKAASEKSKQWNLQESVMNTAEIPTSVRNESVPPKESTSKSSSPVERRGRLSRKKSGSSQSISNGTIMFNSLTLPLISGNAPSDLQFSMGNSSATIHSQEMIKSQTQNGFQNMKSMSYAANSLGSSPIRIVPSTVSKPTVLWNVMNGNSYVTLNTGNAAKNSLQRSEPNNVQMKNVGDQYIMGKARHPSNVSSFIQTGTSWQSCNTGSIPVDFQGGRENQARAFTQGFVAGNTPIFIDRRYVPVSSQVVTLSQVVGTVPHGQQMMNHPSTNHDGSIPKRILITQPHQVGNMQSIITDSHTHVYQTSNPSVTTPPSNSILNSSVVTTSDKHLRAQWNQSQESNQIGSSPSSAPTSQTLPVRSACTSPQTLNITSGQVLNGQSIGQNTHGRPETSASCERRKQHTDEPQASLSNGQKVEFSHKGLMAGVNAEERKRELLEELCMLENIKTCDRGLDILLLSNLLKIRGLSTINKEVLKLSEQKMKSLIESFEQRPQTEEERIQNIVDLKTTVSQAP